MPRKCGKEVTCTTRRCRKVNGIIFFFFNSPVRLSSTHRMQIHIYPHVSKCTSERWGNGEEKPCRMGLTLVSPYGEGRTVKYVLSWSAQATRTTVTHDFIIRFMYSKIVLGCLTCERFWLECLIQNCISFIFTFHQHVRRKYARSADVARELRMRQCKTRKYILC